ncbi:hypothetical protein [Gynuella sunshinyii]|uniref:Chromosome segregation ATPase n=1 Tax=Gynuella sunshinyii YC6258 TaxID=1445510 RepID=A0A0C5VVM8_9GAMM|nr:hypothetical protein [Gynuella sunshinyii]AJQ94524.1 chromosome segregation ATPase [Gynuella sunshinyii YC6258]
MNRPSGPKQNMDELPSLVPDRDEIVSRQRSLKSSRSKPGQAAKPADKKTGTGFLWFWVVLLITVNTGLGWWCFQLYSKLEQAGSDRAILTARVEAMEQQMSATDENLVLNETSLQNRFSNIMAEIRKLWDVSNKRNKAWIQTNQEDIKNIIEGNKQADKSLTAILEQLAPLKEQLNTQQTTVVDLQSLSQEAKIGLEALKKNLNDLQKQYEAANARMDELALGQQLLSDQSQLEPRISSLEQKEKSMSLDLESISTSRTQVSARLVSLQNQIKALEQQILELKGTP